MFNSVRKGFGFVKNIMMQQMSSEDLPIETLHSHLVDAIRLGEDYSGPLEELISSNVPLKDKYAVLDAGQLILFNSQSVAQLSCIKQALDCTLKYARHLVKPSHERSQQWREIRFANVHVENKIKPMKGFELVLQELGYTELHEQGMRYPDGCNPDLDHVYCVIAEITLMKKEIALFLQGSHPHKAYIEEGLPQTTRDELYAFALSEEGVESVQGSDTTEKEPLSLFPGSKAFSPARPEQNTTRADQHTAPEECCDAQLYDNYTITPSAPQEENLASQQVPATDPSQQFVGVVEGLDIFSQGQALLMQQPQEACIPTTVDAAMKGPEGIQDIVPETSEMAEVAGTLNSSGLNTSSSSLKLLCDVCGFDAVSFCIDCQRKALCDDCNNRWHQHPNRRGHKVQSISTVTSMTFEDTGVHIDPAYGVSAHETPHKGRVRISKSHVPAKQVSQPESNHHTSGSLVTGIIAESAQRITPTDQQIIDCQQNTICLPKEIGFEPFTGSASPNYHTVPTHQSSQFQGQGNVLQGSESIMQGNASHSQFNAYGQYIGNSNFAYPGQAASPSAVRQPGVYAPMPYPSASSPSPVVPSYIDQQLYNQRPSSAYLMQEQVPTSDINANAVNPFFQQPRMLNAEMNRPHPGQVYGIQGMVQKESAYPPMPSLQPSSHMPPMQQYPYPSQQQDQLRYPGSHATANFPNPPNMNYNPIYPGHISLMPQSKGNQTLSQPSCQSTALSNQSQAWQGGPGAETPSASGGTSERKQSLVTSSASIVGSFQSKLVKKLMQEKDPKRQRDKCDLVYENLLEDIDELDNDLNQKMTESEDDFLDSYEYKDMSRRKRKLMQEKKALEAFQKQFDEETQVVHLSKQHLERMNHITQANKLVQQTYTAAQAGATVQKIFYPPEMEEFSKPSKQTEPSTELSTELAQTSAPCQTRESKILNVLSEQTTKTASDFPPARPPSIAAVDPAIRQNLLPSEDTYGGRQPVENSFPEEQCSPGKPPFLPQPPALPPKKGRNSRLDISFPPPMEANIAAPRVKTWECEHCTFINEGSSHICAICDKTSDNPHVIREIGVSPEDNVSPRDQEGGSGSGSGEEEPAPFGEDRLIQMLMQMKEEEVAKVQGSVQGSDDDVMVIRPSKDVGARIAGIQDEVFEAKRRAKQEYEEGMNKKEKEMKERFEEMRLANMEAQRREPVAEESIAVGGCPPINIQHNPDTTSSGSSDTASYITATTSDPSFSVPLTNVQGNPEASPPQDREMRELLGRLDQATHIDKLASEGAELNHWIKKADKEGFEVDAVSVALAQCINLDLDPLTWLRQYWKANVTRVMERAWGQGAMAEHNCVGEMTFTEAQAAYMQCEGNLMEAVDVCVGSRQKLYHFLNNLGEFPREEILEAMRQTCGNQTNAERLLQTSVILPYVERVWSQDTVGRLHLLSDPRVAAGSFSTSVISHGEFQAAIRDVRIDGERRTRMILVEGRLKSWGRAQMVISLLDQMGDQVNGTDITVEDVVEAVRNCNDRRSAWAYLQQECQICYAMFPMSKVHSLNVCQCKLCRECLVGNFEVAIREKHVRQWTCPVCSLPDLGDTDIASDFLQFLLMLLQPLITRECMDLFDRKIIDWHLQKDPNFRWCALCASGFIGDAGHLRMTCPYCQGQTCFSCKKQWEPQHEGVSCEQFQQWKIDNDPNNQSVGLAKHLEKNGIDCPTCKMRYDLAKGGCMHFKCPNCGHEFCSGCNEPYYHKNVCQKYRNCAMLGLHCHCPRDCFAYLRDFSVEILKQLLQSQNKVFNMDAPGDQADANHCPVMEQKEFDLANRDEMCGRATERGHAGLCESHYKEYLVGLINRHSLDPVGVMTLEEMQVILRKYDLAMPEQGEGEPEGALKSRLGKMIRDRLPLRKPTT